jgi:signal transduction histidine kinase
MQANRLSAAAIPHTEPAGEQDGRTLSLLHMLRLRWFIRLRWVFLAAAVAVLAAERFLLPEVRRPPALLGVLVTLAAVNVCWMLLSDTLFRRVKEVGAAGGLTRPLYPVLFAHAQVAVDLLALTMILRYSGGVENPLAIFYLFHMAIVALLLQRWQAVLQGAWALLLYALLVIGEWRGWLQPHYEFLPQVSTGVYLRPEYVFSLLTVVACGIFGMLYFTCHIVARMEARERELQRANAALRQAQQAIADLQRRRSRFMQVAAHQLKSPLAVIQTLADLIRSRIVPEEGIAPTCDKIIARCRDGINQVGRLLTLARVQDADPSHHLKCETDVLQVVSDLCQRFGPLAEAKNLQFTCRLPQRNDLIVRIDPNDLRDCIANLIENAIKYTPGPGSVSVTVIPKFSRGQLNGVAINVTDTGIGIDPGLLTPVAGEPGQIPVFDAFRRGSNAIVAGIPGSGLGLSIVREVVEQAGGRIMVSSRPGEGSSFTVVFPIYAGPVVAPPVRTTRASEVVPAGAGVDRSNLENAS